MGGAWRTTATFSDLDQNLHVISQQIYVLRETLGRFQGVVERDQVDGEVSHRCGTGQLCLLLFFLFSQEKHGGGKRKQNYQPESVTSNLCFPPPRHFAV